MAIREKSWFAVTVLAAVTISGSLPSSAWSIEKPPSVAVLDVRIINDNEGLDPLSDAEQARVVKLETQLKSALAGSKRYRIVHVTPDVKAAIDKGQFVGECGGCEADFGKKLGADRIAWVTVQKISNLILNLNVYIADVATNKMTFLKSVDIRGNTDESWSRSMTYLLKNYLLTDPSQQGAAAPTQ